MTILPAPARFASPGTTTILFFFIRKPTPFDNCCATFRERSTIFAISNLKLSALKPNSFRRCIRCQISEDQQRLGRDAAPIEADAAQPVSLDDRRLESQLRGANGADVAGGA